METSLAMALDRELTIIKAEHGMNVWDYLQYKSAEVWDAYFQGAADAYGRVKDEAHITYKILDEDYRSRLSVSD